jgi:hypothetical protein
MMVVIIPSRFEIAAGKVRVQGVVRPSLEVPLPLAGRGALDSDVNV